MPKLLVIGGASQDTLHLNNLTVQVAGGAGMYTAIAAKLSGANASMYAPKPEPMPANLQFVVDGLDSWLGPIVSPDELPRFEIVYEAGEIPGHFKYDDQATEEDEVKYTFLCHTPLLNPVLLNECVVRILFCAENGAAR